VEEAELSSSSSEGMAKMREKKSAMVVFLDVVFKMMMLLLGR
jgi:hypothetical protein